ncbi:MAG TPA: hypothetical protein VFX19_02985 [Dehalococcoidia bacterium]|jgi:hypothetical protein|nr:hypothetical protein [Dehalococcoidia bacterium]
MQLELDDGELELVDRILKQYLPQLREEVYKTESYDLRESMKRDEAVLKQVIEKVDAIHAQ